MFVRAVLLLFIAAQFAVPAVAQNEVPPRPKVISTPEPTAEPKKKRRAPVKHSAPKTPEQLLAGYMPKVKAALARRWGAAVTARMAEFSPGNLSVNFMLDAEGKVTAVTVASNTSNEPFVKFCDQFVRETKFDPPPAGALADGQVAIPFTFTIY